MAPAAAAGGIAAVIILVVELVIALLVIIGMWKMFAKAGKPGWAAIVPVYNFIVMLQIAGKPVWWIILMFVPIANLIIAILTMAGISKAFGRGVGTTIGLILLGPIFVMILGFGSAEYQDPNAVAAPAPEPEAAPAAE